MHNGRATNLEYKWQMLSHIQGEGANLAIVEYKNRKLQIFFSTLQMGSNIISLLATESALRMPLTCD